MASSALRSDRRGALARPGCLTGESEERETWTAESLRAGCVWWPCESKAIHMPSGRTRLRRYTFQVNTKIRIGAFACRSEGRWDLVKRCDQPEQNLIQLESLILAQSERWRQA